MSIEKYLDNIAKSLTLYSDESKDWRRTFIFAWLIPVLFVITVLFL